MSLPTLPWGSDRTVGRAGSHRHRIAFQPSYRLQSDEVRATLLARYPPDKLFQAERNFNAAQDLDVSLLEGDLVGVIKKKDPMGSQNRWLIDNGGGGSISLGGAQVGAAGPGLQPTLL